MCCMLELDCTVTPVEATLDSVEEEERARERSTGRSHSNVSEIAGVSSRHQGKYRERNDFRTFAPSDDGRVTSTLESGQTMHHEPPPPYEEAVKYPSISSLLSTFDHSSHPGICNNGLLSDSIVITISSEGDSSTSEVLTASQGERAGSVSSGHSKFTGPSRVIICSQPFRSRSCSDLPSINQLPRSDKSLTVTHMPLKIAEASPPRASCPRESSETVKLPHAVNEVNFSCKMTAHQPCTSSEEQQST